MDPKNAEGLNNAKSDIATHFESASQRVYKYSELRSILSHYRQNWDLNPDVQIDNFINFLKSAINLDEANLFVTAKHHYRRKPQKVREAETANLPIYVLRSNTPTQIKQFLSTLYSTESAIESSERTGTLQVALGEAQEAVNLVKNGQAEVELSPQSAYIRRLQHLIAERNELTSKSSGDEPQRSVRIYKE